jgi:hypothetical protein
MLQLPVLAAYMPHSLSLGRERRKHNHQADDTTCLPLSLHLTLSCCVTRETEGKTQKFQKIKTGAILKRDDQVITLLFQCLLVGLFSQQKNRKKKIQPTF